uniref:Sec-independent protein translocase protein TatA n=1 Tax=Fundidesulfovibrio putealis TaxID=270496 RepID=A0A7C4AGD2_9BACT
MFGLGFWELSLILIVVLLLFGGSKLPDLGRGLGKAIKEFRKSTSEPDQIDVSGTDKDDKDKRQS